MFRNIIVGISGGVDSAVAAHLLKTKGYNVTGVFMRNWDIIDEKGNCTVEKDYEDAQWVCDKLKIPLIEFNFVKEYWNDIFSDFIEKYQSGCTPNPDILCNKLIKFEKFYHVAREKYKADAIATGHYVKTSFGPYLEHFQQDTNVQLLRASDPNKDQTFFLCQVPQKTLRYCMFPLGEYLKQNVRQIAIEAGLDLVSQKKESMGICFVGKREFQEFISEYINDNPGEFVDLDTGLVVGQHNGIHHWTIGQRCKIGGNDAPYFVFQKQIESNRILVVRGTNHPALYTDILITENPHWIAGEPEKLRNCDGILECDFRFQHRDPVIPCKVFKTQNNQLIIQLSKPLRAVTQGQYAVLYSGDVCLGGSPVLYPGPSYFVLNKSVNGTDKQNNRVAMHVKV